MKTKKYIQSKPIQGDFCGLVVKRQTWCDHNSPCSVSAEVLCCMSYTNLTISCMYLYLRIFTYSVKAKCHKGNKNKILVGTTLSYLSIPT